MLSVISLENECRRFKTKRAELYTAYINRDITIKEYIFELNELAEDIEKTLEKVRGRRHA